MRSAYDLETDRGTEWLLDAACRGYDPRWWEVSRRGTFVDQACNEEARRICRTCPVADRCQEQADRLGGYGMIVAGKTWKGVVAPVVFALRCERPMCRAQFTTIKTMQRFCTPRCKSMEHERTRGRTRA